MFWTLFSPKDLYKAYGNASINSQKVEYSVNSLPGRHSLNFTFTKRGTLMGYTDFVIEKSAISGKYQKASLSSYCGFKRNDPILSTGKGFGNNRTVPPISYKRLSFSKRDLSTHWETVPFSNCCYFSSYSPQIHSKAIDF